MMPPKKQNGAAAKAKPSTAIKTEQLDPKNSITFCTQTKLLQELFTFIKNFDSKFNITFRREGFRISLMDQAHVSLIHLNTFGVAMDRWSWTLENRDLDVFVVGLNIESTLKILRQGNKLYKYVRFIISPDSDNINIQFYTENREGDGPLFRATPFEEYTIKCLDIESGELDVPDRSPDIEVKMKSTVFNNLVTSWKDRTDKIGMSFSYSEKRTEVKKAKTTEKEDRIKEEIHGKDAKRVDMIDKERTEIVELTENMMIFDYNNSEKYGTGVARFKLYFEGDTQEDEDEDPLKAVPAWERYTIMSRDLNEEGDEQQEEEDGKKKRNIDASVTEELEFTVLSKYKETNQLKLGSKRKAPSKPSETNVGIIMSTKPKSTALPKSFFGVKLLHFSSLGKSINEYCTLELTDDMPMCVRYDIGDFGILRCYMAPQIENSDGM